MRSLKEKSILGLWVEKAAFFGFLSCTAYLLFNALPGNLAEGAAATSLKGYLLCVVLILVAWLFRNPYFIMGLMLTVAGVISMTISLYGLESSRIRLFSVVSSTILLISAVYALLRGVRVHKELAKEYPTIALDRTS